MKREDVRAAYYDHTAKVSDLVRQLSFAGIALVWVFKNDVQGKPRVPTELVMPATLVVAALGLDLIQYVYASAAWGIFNRRLERRDVKADDEFTAPPKLNWPTLFFFWAKLSSVLLAYVYFLRYLWSVISGG